MKLKSFHNFLVVLIIVLASCDENDSNSIVIEEKSVTVWIGHETSVAIHSNASTLSVKSDNEKIATAMIKNDSVFIYAHDDYGATTLRITDGSNNEAEIQVHVQTIHGSWKETETDKYKCEAVVDAEDKEVEALLSQELWEYAAKRLNTIYGFGINDLEIITPNRDRYSGSYQFGNQILTLNYDNSVESYKATLLGLRFILLTQDFTDLYKNQYPEAGISKAIVNRYITYISL